MEFHRTIFENGTGEIVEKRSRFIADIRHVESEEEALAVIENIRKKHWDARHHCFAYIIGSNQQTVRASDDGEPQGTAGRPMLDILLGEELYDTIAVVTRYFGGTLLGTGGLVRAYTGAVREGLANCAIVEKKNGILICIGTDYTGIGKIQYLLGQKKIPVLASDYGETVTMEIVAEAGTEDSLIRELLDALNGKVQIEKVRDCTYAEVDGEVLVE